MGPARCARPVGPALITDAGWRYATRVDEETSRRVVDDASPPARWAIARIVLVAVSAVLWLAVVAATVWGVVLIARHASFWSVNVGIGLLLLVILLRPRVGRAPRRSTSVARAAAPQLWQLIDRVCSTLDAPAPDRLVLDLGFTASTTRRGIANRVVLRLGARLWVAAEPEQRIAVLAAELAHLSNGDPARMRFVRPVLDTFDRLANAGQTRTGLGELCSSYLSRFNVLGLIVALVQWTVGRLCALVHLGLRALALPQHLRGEYLSDVDAAQVAGTSALLGVLDRLRLADEIERFLYHAATDRRPDQWGAGVYALVAMRPRPTVATEADTLTLWADRPTTVRRTEVVTDLPWQEPTVVADAEASAALDRELTSWREALRDELLGSREFVER